MLAESFAQPYKGDTLQKFVDILEAYKSFYDDEQHYGRYITILQSSGSGKSRLMRDIRQRVSRYLYSLDTN